MSAPDIFSTFWTYQCENYSQLTTRKLILCETIDVKSFPYDGKLGKKLNVIIIFCDKTCILKRRFKSNKNTNLMLFLQIKIKNESMSQVSQRNLSFSNKILTKLFSPFFRVNFRQDYRSQNLLQLLHSPTSVLFFI